MANDNEKISIVARELDEKGVLKTYASYIPSFVLSRYVDFLASAIDHWILAYLLGATALGVTSRMLPLHFWMLLVFSLFDGIHIYISHAFGENNLHKVNSLFTLSIYLILILTAVSIILYRYFPIVLYLLRGSAIGSGYLLNLGHEYLLGLSWGIFPLITLSTLSYMVRIDGSKYLPIYASSAVIVSNIILDFLLIGKFRYFGAGIATSISYWIGAIIIATHFLKKTCSYKLLTILKFPEVSFKKLINLTCPRLTYEISKLCKVSCLTFFGFRSAGIIFGIVHSIYNIAHSFIYTAIVGIVTASKPLIGIAYGQNDYNALHNILYAMHKIVLPITGGLCLFLFAFPQLFPLVMNLHPYDEAFQPACTAMRLLTICAILYAPTFIYRIYYQQIGHEKFISIINLLESTLFVIPFYYFLSPRDNANGFWWANIYMELITLLVLLVFHLWQSHKLRDKYLGA